MIDLTLCGAQNKVALLYIQGDKVFIDTHCHLNMMVKQEPDVALSGEQLKAIADIVSAAGRVGVEKIINVGTSLQESINSLEIAKKFPSVFATIGIHPCDSNVLSFDDLKDIMHKWRQLLMHKQDHKIIGLGETGLDFYHKPFDRQRQVDFFKTHIELGLEFDLPLVIHVRESIDEALKIIDEYRKNGLRGVLHCFLQEPGVAQEVTSWGFYVGLDAPITYPKNQWLRDMFKNVALEHIILETDAPFLPPQQFRGQQNSPINIPIIAQALAEIKEVPLEVVEQVTTANVEKLFQM